MKQIVLTCALLFPLSVQASMFTFLWDYPQGILCVNQDSDTCVVGWQFLDVRSDSIVAAGVAVSSRMVIVLDKPYGNRDIAVLAVDKRGVLSDISNVVRVSNKRR